MSNYQEFNYWTCEQNGQAYSLQDIFRELFGSIGSFGVSSLGPDENGWYDFTYSYPPKNVLLQFERRWPIDSKFADVERWVGYNDFYPEFNVAGLYWRYTGIGREQMEAQNGI